MLMPEKSSFMPTYQNREMTYFTNQIVWNSPKCSRTVALAKLHRKNSMRTLANLQKMTNDNVLVCSAIFIDQASLDKEEMAANFCAKSNIQASQCLIISRSRFLAHMIITISLAIYNHLALEKSSVARNWLHGSSSRRDDVPIKIQTYSLTSQSPIQKCALWIPRYLTLVMRLFCWFEPTRARGPHQPSRKLGFSCPRASKSCLSRFSIFSERFL